MTDILASGISATTKYDNRTENAEKVLPRLDMRLLATNLQYLLETTQGYSRSGNEGFAQAQNTLSTITVNNYEQYNKSLLQAISTLISHRNYLEVDNSSTPNAITLIKSKITTENAPNNQNYTRENELPFKFQNNLTFTFKAKDNNTGSVSVSIPSLDGFTGSINLVNQDLTSLSANDIIQNYIYEITADRTNNRFILTPHLRKATNQIRGINFLNQPITIANNTTDANNDIDLTAGNFQFSDNSGEALASAMTKRLDASWTAGTNQGGLDTGTKQANTWYHCYAIYNPTTQVSDFIFSANATSPTLPSGFTKFSYKGSILTNISGNIIAFEQNRNYFEWKNVIKDFSSNIVYATKTSFYISTPLGVKVIAVCRAGVGTSDPSDLCINILSTYNDPLLPLSGDGQSYDSDIGADVGYVNGTNLLVPTNLNSQIAYIASRNATLSASFPFVVRTKGYFNYSI